MGWLARPAMAMLPPSHAAADVHDLGSRRPPAQAWLAHPGWAGLQAPATGGELRGCVAEGLGGELVVFTWGGMPRRGQQRWHELLAVGEALQAVVMALDAPHRAV